MIKKKKIRVMLIPDAIPWILGTWALEICKWNKEKYEFLIFPADEIKHNKLIFMFFLKNVDIVHYLSPWDFSEALEMIKKLNFNHLTVISSIHHIFERETHKTCHQADKIMTVCRKYYDELTTEGVSAEKLFLIYNGVDAEFFKPKDKFLSKRALGIPDADFSIGFCGKESSDIKGRKGADIFIQAATELSLTTNSKIQIIVTGPGWDKILKNSPLKNIHYFPFLDREKMPDFFNSLDVFLVTSRAEGCPVPLLEAMSCGVPPVTTPVGVVDEFLTSGLNCEIVPIGNVTETVHAVLKLMNDRKRLESYGKAVRNIILKELQWKDTVSNIHKYYGETPHPKNRIFDFINYDVINKILIDRDIKRWNKTVASTV